MTPPTGQTGKRAAYAAYKPSGTPWLGDVPEHWKAMRLRFLVSEPLKYGANESAELDDPNLPRYIRITDVDENGHLRDDTFKSLPEDVARPYLLKEGDILLARSGATVGKSFHYESSWGKAAYAGYLIRARFHPKRVLSRFANYFTSSQQYWQWLGSSFIQATIQNVSAEKYANMNIPVPPVDEQETIAAFLDRETMRIDALIEKKRLQIELLQEKRSALISHAVTKGLNPNAPMKDSGIEWLGKVPTHWDVLRLKRIACIGNGSTPSRENMEYWANGSFPWLNSSVVNQVRVIEGSDFVTDLALRECHLPRLSPPTVVVGITGEGKTRGMATVVEIECTINQHLAFIKPKDGAADAAYIRYLFLPLYDFLRRESSGGGSTKGAITCENLANLKIPCPPIHEQTEIIDRIELEASQTDTLLTKVEQSIDLLREHRAALISAAVTGKIDVREEVSGE